MAIRFKSPEMEAEYMKIHSSTHMIVDALVRQAKETCGKDIEVTSVFRGDNKKSVHAYWRAVDIRVDGAWDDKMKKVVDGPWGADTLTTREAAALVSFINGRYLYDPLRKEKKAAVFGAGDETNKHWDHIHIQGHPNSRLALSVAPKIPASVLAIAEDYVDVPTIPGTKISIGDKVWAKSLGNPTISSALRRTGKVASAVAVIAVLNRLGVSNEVATAIGLAYLPIEKAVNVEVSKKTGKNENFDWASLLLAIAKWIGRLLSRGGA